MKRKLLMAVGLVLAVAFMGTASAKAINAHRGDTMTVSKGEVVDATIYRFGKRILIEGTVKGDVYCAGQTVEITGTVEGDVLCAAQEIRIGGTVQGDVRAAAQNLFVLGDIKGGASLAGQTISIEDKATIGRDATIAGQTFRLAGKIGRDVVNAGSIAMLAGPIGRNADLYGDQPIVQSSAQIGGNFTYTSKHDAQIDKGAVIKGETTHHQPPQRNQQPSVWPGRIMNPLSWLIGILVVAGAALLLTPRWFKGTTTLMLHKPFGAVGLGIAMLLLTPILAVLLMVTLIGLPLGVPLLVVWFFALVASYAFVAYAIGSWLLVHLPWLEKGREFAALLIGALLVVLFIHIPIFGFWLGLLATFWGLGGIFWAIARSIHNQHKSPKIKTKKA